MLNKITSISESEYNDISAGHVEVYFETEDSIFWVRYKKICDQVALIDEHDGNIETIACELGIPVTHESVSSALDEAGVKAEAVNLLEKYSSVFYIESTMSTDSGCYGQTTHEVQEFDRDGFEDFVEHRKTPQHGQNCISTLLDEVAYNTREEAVEALEEHLGKGGYFINDSGAYVESESGTGYPTMSRDDTRSWFFDAVQCAVGKATTDDEIETMVDEWTSDVDDIENATGVGDYGTLVSMCEERREECKSN